MCRSHKRIKQLEASLERLAGMDFVFGERYVVVNIPAAFAEAVEDDKVVRRYRVIVGKAEKPSPTLTADITRSTSIRPGPCRSSIAKNEISAHMRKDPSYLEPHAHATCSAPMTPRSIRIRWTGPARIAELHRPSAIRHLQRARRGQDRHAESVFGLHARHQPAKSVQRRLPLRLAWLLARRQCARSRRLAVEGHSRNGTARRSTP